MRRVSATALGHFEEARRPHPTADAHGADDIARPASLALDQRVADHPRAAHAVRVPDGDGATVDVEPLHREAEPVAAVDHLDGEGLVQLPEVDVVLAEAE